MPTRRELALSVLDQLEEMLPALRDAGPDAFKVYEDHDSISSNCKRIVVDLGAGNSITLYLYTKV